MNATKLHIKTNAAIPLIAARPFALTTSQAETGTSFTYNPITQLAAFICGKRISTSPISAASRTTVRLRRHPSRPGEEGRDPEFTIPGRNFSGAERGMPLAGPDGNPVSHAQRLRVLRAPPTQLSARPTAENPTGSLAVGGRECGQHNRAQ